MTSDFKTMQANGTLTQRKQRIYEEAAKLFRDKGFAGTSVRDLATAVSLEPSSLYSHISSKEEILHHICFNCAHRFLGSLAEVQKTPGSASNKLRELIEMHVRIAQTDATSIIVFNDEWRHLTEPELTEFVGLRKQYEDGCLNIIEKGMTGGEFRSVDPHVVLNSLLSSTLWIHRSNRAHHLEPGKLAEQIADMLLFGLNEPKTQ